MRSNPRKTPRRGRRQARNLSLLVLFVIVLAVLIIISPNEPTKSALNVNAQGQVVSVYEGLVISEAMSANASAYPDEGGNFVDWLELANHGDTDIDLLDITLSNRPDKAKFIFPAHILKPGERVRGFFKTSDTFKKMRTLVFLGTPVFLVTPVIPVYSLI